ncbi:MAG: cyclohexanecarboxylate-CoA ligase, partial [Fimbriimonadales bacterium]
MKVPVYPKTLWALLAGRAQSDPDRILIEDDKDRTLTAAQWVDSAERVAAGLQDLGVESDTVVTWQLPTIIDSCVL